MSCIKTIAESTAGGRKLFKIKTITKVNEKRLKVKEIVPLIKLKIVRLESRFIRFVFGCHSSWLGPSKSRGPFREVERTLGPKPSAHAHMSAAPLYCAALSS